MLETFTGVLGGLFSVTGAITLVIGACAGWCIPQPAFMQSFTEMVCDRFGLGKLHQEGHAHSDAHEAHLQEEKTVVVVVHNDDDDVQSK